METNPRPSESRFVKERTEHKKTVMIQIRFNIVFFVFYFVFHSNWENGVLRVDSVNFGEKCGAWKYSTRQGWGVG